VQLWSFAAASFLPVHELNGPLVLEPAADDSYCQLQQFPREFFAGGKLSRKGFLLTRWRLGASHIVDLINIHNLHDESNVVAVQRVEGKSVSGYAERRQATLQYTMRMQQESARTISTNISTLPHCFIFGDFNFRLNMSSVVEFFCGATELERAQSMPDEKSQKIELLAMERPLAADSRVAIEFGAKRFKLRNPDAVVNEHELFRSFCNEVTAYCVVAASPLLELPVTFSPSYNYDPEELVEGSRGKLRRGTSIGEKGILKGASNLGDIAVVCPTPKRRSLLPRLSSRVGSSIGSCQSFRLAVSGKQHETQQDKEVALKEVALLALQKLNPKRCPAWCDRVLMDPAAFDLVNRAAASEYCSAFQTPVVTDHNPVALAFDLM